VTIAFILSNALLPDGVWGAFGLSLLFLLFATALSNLGITFTLKRSFIALPFALVAVTVLFSIPGNPLTSFHFLLWDLTITDAGFLRFVSIVIRSWLSVQMAILLVGTARFPDIVHALEHLRVPMILTTIIAFLYRYLFVLADEVFRLLRAREARSAAAPGSRSGGSVAWRAGVVVLSASLLWLKGLPVLWGCWPIWVAARLSRGTWLRHCCLVQSCLYLLLLMWSAGCQPDD